VVNYYVSGKNKPIPNLPSRFQIYQTMPLSDSCQLCGISLRFAAVTLNSSGKTLSFCCMGCRQVYVMLVEATDAGDPETFRDTDLFKKCVKIGIIPRSAEDLRKQERDADSLPTEIDSGTGRIEAGEKTLNLNLMVTGMWCPACAWVIEKSLAKLAGIAAVSCDFSTDMLFCRYHPVATSPDRIMDAVTHLGYRVGIPDEGHRAAEKKREFIQFAVSAFLTMNVMMLSFALYSGFFFNLSRDAVYKISFPIFIMAGVVLFYCGRDILRKAWSGMVSASPGMETLVCIGALSAYAYSTFHLLSAGIHLYFDTASVLITLVLLGKTIEGRAKSLVQADLISFFKLWPTKVKICTDAYPEGRYVAAERLRDGDTFRIEAGEIVPADGVILKGSGTVDESSLTGESRPVAKKTGDRLKSGTKVINDAFRARADGVGENSTLGRMIDVMTRALGQKTPLEGKTDAILKWFVPAIILLALSTGIACRLIGFSSEISLLRAVTVLVISCPCALGIAIPMARVAGISLAGKKGLLVRSFSAFERVEKVDTFVFDKTGTLTIGRWALLEIRTVGSFSKNRVLEMAAGLEKGSEHYIALEIKNQARKRDLKPAKITQIRSRSNGRFGYYGNEQIKIGSKDYLSEEIRACGSALNTSSDETHSRIYLSIDGRLIAVFVFGDEIKESSADTVETLKKLGYRTILVSGDGARTTRAVGRKIGITEIHGGRSPQDKVFFIEALRNAGHTVAMVGDGINDAPALARSDLAVAVHSGYNLGREASDITLMRGDPGQITEYLTLAKRVNQKIHQNLWFSLIYNLVSIPVAMAGMLNPLVAAAAMLLSSLSVSGSTLLLIGTGTKSNRKK